jgi:hypothetical protein
MGDEIVWVERISRIYYDGGYCGPISILNVIKNAGCLLSCKRVLLPAVCFAVFSFQQIHNNIRCYARSAESQHMFFVATVKSLGASL